MKKQQGFTLIELMIVVAVIGVLSAIAIPKYQEFAKKGAVASGIATLTALKINIEDYMAQEGAFPSDVAAAGGIASNALGTINVANSAAKITFATGAAGTAIVKLLRESDGNWNCSYGKGTIASDLKIAGCKYDNAVN